MIAASAAPREACRTRCGPSPIGYGCGVVPLTCIPCGCCGYTRSATMMGSRSSRCLFTASALFVYTVTAIRYGLRPGTALRTAENRLCGYDPTVEMLGPTGASAGSVGQALVTIACSTLNRLARSLGASSLPRVVRAGVIIPSGIGLDGLPVHSSCDAHNLGQTPHSTAPAMARASPPSSSRRRGGEGVQRQRVGAAAKGTQSALSDPGSCVRVAERL